MKVMFLEDDERVARGLVRLVSAMGHEAVHVRTVEEGVAQLKGAGFDVVVADLGLTQGQTGLDLLKWVAQECPDVRRVLTSGAVRPSGFVEDPPRQIFLNKPFGRLELNRLLAPH